MGTIVVAVGGNALAPGGVAATVQEQFSHTRESLDAVVKLAAEGWRIAMIHGNGPQVGDALLRNEMASRIVPPLPLGVLVAGTAGWIGYMIQQSLQNGLRSAGIDRQVLTVITQTVVAPDDPKLKNPTKPIGHGLSEEEADTLRVKGIAVGRDGAGRWRRLAPSPTPLDIVEADAIQQLVDEGKLVIAAGGGGPPVCRTAEKKWEGVDAVVDKDRTAAILADRLKADTLLMLTDVEAVYRDWGTDRATPVSRLTVAEAKDLLETGQLGRGSMAPKVDAAVGFVEGEGHKRRAVIAHLAEGVPALKGETGTTIVEDVR